MTQAAIPHTRLNREAPARVGPPRPPECHRDTPPPPLRLPEVDYTLRPRPLPLSGTFSAARMASMIDSLPDRCHRDIVTLRYLYGYEFGTIADTLAYSRSAIWHMHNAAIAELNQLVQQKIDTESVEAGACETGSGWIALAFVAGMALMAIAWWVTDTALLTSESGQYSRWIIDLDKLRPWAAVLLVGGPVAGWFARFYCERTLNKEEAEENE